MYLLKHCIKIIVSLIIVIISVTNGLSQVNIISTQAYDSILAKKQQEALAMFNQEDTISTSAYWPNIKPSLFFSNVRNNISYPAIINQGLSTNFCGYAAMTHLLLKYNPAIYLHHVISLYRTGKTMLEKKALEPSLAVRNTAGTLKNKAELDILDADQLWFLTLADQFKGYMNVFDHKYNPGDENKMWAGTNLAKFNRMLKDFTKDTLTMVGSDFIRPLKNSFYDYISKQLHSGIVLLYVNSKFLYPHKFTLFKLRAPTHFIVLYDMDEVDDLVQIRYWDYGLKTEQLITRKRLRKLIFGVTTINHEKIEK